jgi:hypothetical protein
MWKLNPTELLQLRGGGGERFTAFVDRLIRAEAAIGKLTQSNIRTQLRANIPDGGVDTQVQAAIANDRLGWFGVPTCWQFKAVDGTGVSDANLREEIDKPFVHELIKGGYGYRFCLLGDLTPEKVNVWENELTSAARRINPLAPEAKVLHGGDLLPWAELVPAMVLYLRGASPAIFHLDAWRQNCHASTPKYVPNPEWQSYEQQIRQQGSFGEPSVGGNPCLTVGGAAGVGKTRLVFESLYELPEAAGLVVYAGDEQEAVKVATMIANSGSQHAILVADECTPQTRQLLNDTICRGHAERIRVICLDNTGERLVSKASQIWLSPDALKNTVEILRENYPDVPGDRRHQYANLSKGFVRLAADMCNHDDELRTGNLAGLLGSVEQYVRHRLQGNNLPAISLIALFHKIGFSHEVESDVQTLSALSGITIQQFKDCVRQVRESPGFVVQAGRYWYVTPDIVARILFAEGWHRWVGNDPAQFIQRLPEHLQQQVIDRAGTLGDEEVREQVAQFFRRWFDELEPADLKSTVTVTLLQSIVEAAPQEYLPRLRALLENATPNQVRKITGESRGAKWGPRRTIVWLLERLVSFPEFFEDCEACLFRLALYESEPRIGNNATRIWQSLFNVYLSGTATPFTDRARTIKNRTFGSNEQELQLAFSGLGHSLVHSSGHVIGPDIVAGRLRPADWQPETYDEEKSCYRAAIAICSEHIRGESLVRRRHAVQTLLNGANYLLYRGLCDDLAQALLVNKLSDEEVRRLLKTIDQYIHLQEETGKANANDRMRSYVAMVRTWADSLRPRDFDGKLRNVVARNPWDDRFAKDPRTETDEISDLASEILTTPVLLSPHLDWLASPEAASVERLGFALALRDDAFSTGRLVWEHAISKGAAPLLRGYVRGFVSAHRTPTHEMVLLLEQLEKNQPIIAVDILSFAGDTFDGLNRVLHLIDSNSVPIRALTAFSMGVGERGLNSHDLTRILAHFSDSRALEDADSLKGGLRFLSTVLHRWAHWQSDQGALDNEIVRASAWRIVENCVELATGHLTYDWKHVLAELANYDVAHACAVLGRALLSENLDLSQRAEEGLGELASTNPDQVIEGLGLALLDPKEGWRLQVHVLHDLIAKLPPDTLIRWLSQHGLEGARKIARHLPLPYIGESGEAIVPPALQAVFETYDDEAVFDNFLAGSHSCETWWGNGSDRFRREANDARKFLNHPNRWVREWAKHEISSRLRMAEWEDREHEERFLPS